MPKDASLGLSKKTLEQLTKFKTDFDLKSLEEAIEVSLQWAKMFFVVDAETRRDLSSRVTILEIKTEELAKVLIQLVRLCVNIQETQKKKKGES